MGTINHDAVLGHVWNQPDYDKIEDLRKRMTEDLHAKEKCLIGPIEVVNGDVNFAFLPDGSKEWWETSDAHNRYRDEFISIIEGMRYGTVIWIGWGELDGDPKFKYTTEPVPEEDL
tara:strand:- start:571 stop:918 length:348 start_codon:yes stop_codon:yes gene_type:complete